LLQDGLTSGPNIGEYYNGIAKLLLKL